MHISKQTKKTTLAQQGRYLLICLLSMLLLFLAGSVLILNRTQRQVYEQLEEISKLYTDELDNRFFRISRNLFSDRKSTRLNSSHNRETRMPSSA